MKAMKKAISLILVLLIFSTLLMTACSKQSDNSNYKDEDVTENSINDGAGTETDDVQNQEDNTESQRVLSEAPVKDFEGYEYRILSKGEEYIRWFAKDVVAEEENGEPINDAVYKRNKTIEEKYNIQIVNVPSADLLASAKKSISAGSDEYDIMMGALRGFNDTLAQSGMLVDLKNVPHLDLSKPWYDQRANSDLSIMNKLYVTVSDIGIMDKDTTWVYLFNKKLMQESSLGDPYQLVADGKWTIDKMLEMCKGVSRDLNGDGVMDIEDQYGYAGEGYNTYLGMLSAGVEILKKDTNDIPVYVGIDDAGINVFQKLLSVFGDQNLSLMADHYFGKIADVFVDVMDASFTQGRVLFYNCAMIRVTLFRNMDIDFGILPTPKRDDAQTNYISTISAVSTNSLSIPVTVPDLEKTGIITDAIAAESLYTVIPAYYDVQLKTKFARDNESSEMLDIIFDGRKFDLGLLYDWSGVTSVFETATVKNDPNIVSALEKVGGKIEGQINKTLEAYEKAEN